MRFWKLIIALSLVLTLLFFVEIGNEDFEPIILEVKEEPLIIQGIYLTGWSAGSRSYREHLFDLIDNGGVNAVVIDIKDYSGEISYETKIPDISQLITQLHQKGVYIIGRITVFQDPILASKRSDLAIKRSDGVIWRDRLGLAWVDPSSQDVWDYNISIARQSVELGFDEINFDYIRFPSDGDLTDMVFPFWNQEDSMSQVIAEFYEYLREELSDVVISADLFGLSTVSFTDLGIGQIIEDAALHFDYIYPMTYPSHYASGFLGYEIPAQHPYDVVRYSLDSAIARIDGKKIRPWLQDFSLTTLYDREMVLEQIRATQDSLGNDYSGYLLWDSSNRYTIR